MTEIGWNLDNSYARLPKSLFSRLNPTPVHSPKLIILNYPLATSLGLNAQALQSNDGVAMLAGNQIPEGALPLAQAYAGHQFEHFTMLGDGRALLLGEQITPLGERVDIQLKGSGRTPYSRRGDGRAALGPMLREYIISEAMHAPSWMPMTRQRYSVPLTYMAAMPMAISRILPRGISRDLLKPYCRCCMTTRNRLSNWLRMRFQSLLSCITRIGSRE